jgi:hypothetical protein
VVELWTPSRCYTADDSLKSFLFTLKNPHNILPRRVALNAAEKDKAIMRDCYFGPSFGSDILISNHIVASPETFPNTSHGETYTEDTGLAGDRVFMGGRQFQVKEIEVFEISE